MELNLIVQNVVPVLFYKELLVLILHNVFLALIQILLLENANNVQMDVLLVLQKVSALLVFKD